MAATPIFILGRHRSGTTWISNILASLPEIYVLSHEIHRGVHESAYFSHLVPYCGHGRTDPDLRAVKCLFECSDFFALTGLTQGPDIISHGMVDYFRSIMEAGARKKGARYWLEKTPANTLQAKFLSDVFPDAILLAVVRNYRDVVASIVHGFGEPDSAQSWFWQSMVTAVYEKIIARNRGMVVRYEALLTDYEGTVLSMMRNLGIDSDVVPRSPFHRNTSYQDTPPRNTWWQLMAMAIGRWLVQPLPPWFVERAVIRWRDRTPGTLPPWFFAQQ
ncbi:MAG: sulfotransferase family protein [Woeseiaceae bacterium]